MYQPNLSQQVIYIAKVLD